MLLALLATLGSALAESADDIVARARAANRIDSAIEEIRMTILSKGGGERVRGVVVETRHDAEATRTLMKVTSPSDISGFKVLMIDRPAGPDETMYYVPTAHRVNMVSSANKRVTFIDSNLTMEDLQLRESADGARTLVPELETADHWVVDTATGPESSYVKVRATIAKSDLVLRKLELFDAAGVAKTIEVLRTESAGTVVLPVETLVTDLKRGTRTRLEIVKYELNVDQAALPDDTFTRANLER